MKILHVAETIVGGIASYLDDVVPSQLEVFGRDNVRLLVPVGSAAHLPHVPAENLIEAAMSRRMRRLPALVRVVGMTMRRERPAVVHAHSSFAGMAVRLHPRLGRAVVYAPHGWAFLMDAPAWRRGLYLAVERLLAGRADRIVNVSAFEHREALARRVGTGRSVLIPSGVPSRTADQPTHRGLPTGMVQLLFAGRLDPAKGHDIVVEAMSRLDPERFHLFVAGAADLGHAERASLGNVTYLDWLTRAELARWYARVDAVVVPSRWEAFGLVAAEAMSHGRAVIASDAGALPDLVVPGVTGALFRRNDPVHLAEVLAGLDVDTLRRWGAAGLLRQRDRYTTERVSRDLIELYRSLCPLQAADSQ